MTNEAKNQLNSDRFQDCNSSQIFKQVHRRLSGSSLSLWSRIESEMKRAGVGGADTYLRSVFSELTQEADSEINRCREAIKSGGR